MKSAYLLFSNLKRKKVRTLLTILSILVAFILYGYLVAIRHAFNMGVDVAGADRLVVTHKLSIIQLLPISYGARIANLEGIDRLAHATWFGGYYQEPRNNLFGQIVVEPEDYMDLYPEFVLPPEQMESWLENRTGAVVGRATAEKFGWKVGDKVPLQATIWPQKSGQRTWEFDLVGIYEGAEKSTDTTQFLFRYDYFDEARADNEGQVGWYIVRVKDPDRAEALAASIQDMFANSPYETKAETEMAFIQGFVKQVGNIGMIMVAILSAVFFTILLVAGNTMAQSVRERTNEIGVLKSIGFRNDQVLVMVLAESCLISVLGGGVGLVIAWVLIASGDPTGGALPIFFFPIRDLVIGVALVWGLGLAAGLFPALQAGRLRIADALRKT